MSREWTRPEGRDFEDVPVVKQTKPCDLLTDVVVDELVEVFRHAGVEKTQKPTARKQYVNLDEETDPGAPHPEYGRCIGLKVRVKWKKGDASRSLAGKVVYWTAKAISKWSTKELAPSETEGFGSPGSGDYLWASLTDAAGWTPVVKFYLSQYGGDEFEISASSCLGEKGPKAGPFTVWRRLYYDVAEMKSADGKDKFRFPESAHGRLKAAYADVYIEFEDTGERHLGEYRENFETDPDAMAWARENCGAARVPQKVHFCVVDRGCLRDSAQQQFVEDVAYGQQFTSQRKIFPHDFSGTRWLIKLEYRSEGVYRPLDVEPKLLGTRGRRKFTIDFSGTPVTPTPTAQVLIRLTYLEAEPSLGFADDDTLHIMICKGTEYEYSGSDTDREVAGTAIHETGHALGLVSKKMKWRFRSKEHEGHCRFDTCVMWWSHTAERGSRFHSELIGYPGCRTYLRAKALDRETMRRSWDFRDPHDRVQPILGPPRKI
jgi:hypothetical protein